MISKFYLTKENPDIELCYYLVSPSLNDQESDIIKNILSENGKYNLYSHTKIIGGQEIGPRTNFKTAWCQTMLDILAKCGINSINVIEKSVKYRKYQDAPPYDKMLFQQYQFLTFEEAYTNMSQENNQLLDNIEEVDLIDYNNKYHLGFDALDIQNYQKLFEKLERKPTNVELYDLAQCNSEHARHWFFKGKLNSEEFSLFERIKSCYDRRIHSKSVISFFDNASVIEGGYTYYLDLKSTLNYDEKLRKMDFSYKAETHNFPTGISPFPGASTGSGGRIRDILCVGKGGDMIAGTAGYCVGDIFTDGKEDYEMVYNTPRNILIEASNGASDYGNKIGEPLIQGFTRSYRQDYIEAGKSSRIEWLKPIMFSGGIGKIYHDKVIKNKPEIKNLIVRLGGPAYRIGMGGGSASSRTQNSIYSEEDFQAVQRGDPLMANRLAKFLRQVNQRKENLIVSIHDQGSGGMANVTREICEDMGADVYLDKVWLGDETLTSLEKWVAEYQEQISILVEPGNISELEDIARRENVSFRIVGEINSSDKLTVYKNKESFQKVVDLPMEIESCQKKYQISYLEREIELVNTQNNLVNLNNNNLLGQIGEIFSLVDVGSKQFLTNKVDRSVTGLVVQQQCVGPFHLPLSNLAAVKMSHNVSSVLVSAIGERPILGVGGSIRDMVRLTVGEMLTNIIWCEIGSIRNINSVANWMWPSINSEDGWWLHEAVLELTSCSHMLGFSINGGKDSLSMKVKHNEQEIKAPSTLTLSGYTSIVSHHNIITPDLKGPSNIILLVRLDTFRGALDGSAYARKFGGNGVPVRWDNIEKFPGLFLIVQDYIKDRAILSGHDISDGGLLTTLAEMAFSSLYGLDIDIRSKFKLEEFLFSEELGLVMEVSTKKYREIMDSFAEQNIPVLKLGYTRVEPEILIKYNGEIVLDESNEELRFLWQKTSYMLEKEQANPKCIEAEVENCLQLKALNYQIPKNIHENLHYNTLIYHKFQVNKPRIAIFRGDGSNGEMEMTYAFHDVGFDCYDVTMNDILEGKINLRRFRGIAFVGGFTYGDVLGSAQGWYQVLQNNEVLKRELDCFYQRDDTFSLGVCNGCQLMAKLGWVPNLRLVDNISRRFESRWSKVKIIENDSIFFKGLDGMVFGIYSAHGEGRMVFEEEIADKLCPLRYVDSNNEITEKYPFNPNGSIEGRTSVVSENGRHLAMMPHPERTIFGWQLPIKYEYKYTPWFFMFRNLLEWCTST
jgi:phosphoribosylformylglycinamidine synthase